ncbi:MAG: hypothetical protein P8106_02885 [Gammaproteobacteria bacterium]|jgi:hypothetical protein
MKSRAFVRAVSKPARDFGILRPVGTGEDMPNRYDTYHEIGQDNVLNGSGTRAVSD